MSDDKSLPSETTSETAPEYQTPAIEQVVTRDGFEREVAYAGVVSPVGEVN